MEETRFTKKSIKSLSFEEALKELESIVNCLEQGEADLNSAIEYYSRGVELKKYCQSILAQAKLKVEKIIVKEDKSIVTAPLEAEGF